MNNTKSTKNTAINQEKLLSRYNLNEMSEEELLNLSNFFSEVSDYLTQKAYGVEGII